MCLSIEPGPSKGVGKLLLLQPGRQRGDRRRCGRVLMRPVEARPRQQPDRAAVEPGIHAVAVESDLVLWRERSDCKLHPAFLPHHDAFFVLLCSQ